MASKIDICNSALDKLGVEVITLDQYLASSNKAAGLCKRNYDRLRRKLLRSHWWNFAITRVVLSPSSSTVAWTTGTVYDLPSDNLRFLELENASLPRYVEQDKLIVAGGGDSLGDINAAYIQDFEDVDAMGDTFSESLAYLLASEIAYPLLQSRTTATDMYNKYKVELGDTRTIDSQVSSHNGLEPNQWTGSRQAAGRTSGDRSYYWN